MSQVIIMAVLFAGSYHEYPRSRRNTRTESSPMPTDTIPTTWPVARYITTLQQHLPDLAQQYDITALGVFGSYVRNEQTADSDLDVLVAFGDISRHSLLTIVQIAYELSDLLGVNVDLVLRDGLKPTIGRHILDEVVWI